MRWNRTEIDDALHRLEARAPRLIAANPDEDPFEVIAHEAEYIECHASPADMGHLHDRVSCLLGSLGLIPSDNEGEPWR